LIQPHASGPGRLLAVPVIVAFLTLSLLAGPSLHASAPTTPGSEVVPTVLSGYRSSGILAGSTPVFVTVGIPLQNLQSLEYLTEQMSTPGSPMFRHFLTQQEVQAYLPQAQYESALAFLTSHGLKVVYSALDSVIVAEGSASQADQSLGLHYTVYTNGSSSYYTASGESPISGAYVYSSNVTAVLLAHPPDLVSSAEAAQIATKGPSTSNQSLPSGSIPLADLQPVYNATALYAAGDKGVGYTAGILDFYGDPYIAGQLQYFDEVNGLPSSLFTVTPIGQYNPSLGTYEGWAPEISLDVESVHAMAPHASIDLYVANGALPLASAIATIVQQDKVNDVTQSFGYPESVLSQFGPTALGMNVIMADEYYLLGSAEGITFIASSGDAGASGDSGGPDGTPSYPATSPYVVAVGGTTTYLTYQGTAVSSYEQTAWSSYGFVPYQQNYGGSTGGVSILEPVPWYQSGEPIPPTFASGRLTPDLSLNAAVFPSVNVILPGNLTAGYGGTSESNQLFGGLLTLLMSASKTSFGLLNPTLYDMAQDPSIASKVYDPITFGYNIPWVATQGYNLVTGLGAPNIGEMAHYIDAVGTNALGVNVSAKTNGAVSSDVLPGQSIAVSAVVTDGKAQVTTGSFSAQLDTVAGKVASAQLTYQASSQSWAGTISSPADAAGIAYVTVSGTSGSVAGTGFVQTFTGYLATFFSPSADLPYSAQFGIPIDVNITTLSGTPATGSFTFSASTYSIKSNTYRTVSTVPVSFKSTGFGNMWQGTVKGSYPDGPMMIFGDGSVYGYAPIINGVSMQSSFVETTVLAQPGVVGPGQTIFILASLQSPVNTPAVSSIETNGLPVSFNVEEGSNVTASLVSPSGSVVASSTLYLNSYLTTRQSIQGTITVPSGLQPGLYDVILNSSFNSYDLQTWVNGSYFGQVYVAAALSKMTTTITPSTVFEGQNVAVNAKITYSNGTDVKYGLYSATVYPTNLQNAYNYFSQYDLVQLSYQASTGLWTGNATLPSPYNAGGTVQVDQGALYLSGPYGVFVTGISADGVPSNTNISVQQQLQIQPYLYVSGITVTTLSQWSQVAFSGDTLTGPSQTGAQPPPPLGLSGDLFIGSNTVQGSVTISQSQIQGTLYLQNANVTLVGVTGGGVVAEDSTVKLEQSNLASLQLSNSHVNMSASDAGTVSPRLPGISFQSPSPSSVYMGTSANFTVGGQDVASVSVYLDGALLNTFPASGSYSLPLDAASMTVGVHVLKVVAAQSDGLSNAASVYFSTEGPLVAADQSIGSLSSQVSSENSKVVSLGSQLNSTTELSYGLAAIAVVALLVALVAVTRRPSSQAQSGAPAVPPPERGPTPPPPEDAPPEPGVI
jgi:subtilase family serine protease